VDHRSWPGIEDEFAALLSAHGITALVDVCHLRHDGSVEAQEVTPEARIADTTVVYDGGQMTIAD
jgi:hypothetical protein